MVSSAKTKSAIVDGAQEIVALNNGFQSAFVASAFVALLSAVLAAIFIKTPKQQ